MAPECGGDQKCTSKNDAKKCFGASPAAAGQGGSSANMPNSPGSINPPADTGSATESSGIGATNETTEREPVTLNWFYPEAGIQPCIFDRKDCDGDLTYCVPMEQVDVKGGPGELAKVKTLIKPGQSHCRWDSLDEDTKCTGICQPREYSKLLPFQLPATTAEIVSQKAGKWGKYDTSLLRIELLDTSGTDGRW